MSSSALIDNRLFNKLIANKLVAQEIKTDETFPLTPQYLFSVLFNSNAKFERISDTTGHLIFNDVDITSTIQFSDRPFRKTFDISPEDFLSYFEIIGPDTFRDDPPNAVLVHNEEQRVYTVSNLTNDGSEYRFEMTTLPDETHTAMSTVSGPFSLFVDPITDTTTTTTTIFYPLLKRQGDIWSFYNSSSSKRENITVDRTFKSTSKYKLKININGKEHSLYTDNGNVIKVNTIVFIYRDITFTKEKNSLFFAGNKDSDSITISKLPTAI